MNRAKIILTQFPFTDLTSIKRRPALIVSDKISRTHDLIVEFISSNLKNIDFEYDVIINSAEIDFAKTGLKVSFVVKCNKLATINKSIIIGELGEINNFYIPQIELKLKNSLGLL